MWPAGRLSKVVQRLAVGGCVLLLPSAMLYQQWRRHTSAPGQIRLRMPGYVAFLRRQLKPGFR